MVCPDLRGETACDFAHRGQQRKPHRAGHRLVSDGGDTAFLQGCGAFRLGGQVQIGEEDLALAHARELFSLGLFDLEDHLGAFPHLVRSRDDLRSRAGVCIIGES